MSGGGLRVLTSGDTNRRPVVLCAGIAVEDFLFRVDRFPQAGTKIYAQELVATIGGCAANAAVAVARLGAAARFAGPVGSDEASARFLAGLAREGVAASGAVRAEGGSISVSGIFIDAAGEKMVATRRGENLGDVRAADPVALVADVDVVIADNRVPDFVQPICAAALARGIPVVLDGDRGTRPDAPLFASASHVIFSAEALRATAATTDLAAALRMVASTIHAFLAVTDGPGDVLWIDAGEVRRLPVFAIEAVDTLGAGDTFHGGFGLALAEGRDVVAAMRFAAAAAALKCTRFGGISGTPRREEVEAFLARR
jgi:sugar/nucleoside kinase (ribokinase family)